MLDTVTSSRSLRYNVRAYVLVYRSHIITRRKKKIANLRMSRLTRKYLQCHNFAVPYSGFWLIGNRSRHRWGTDNFSRCGDLWKLQYAECVQSPEFNNATGRKIFAANERVFRVCDRDRHGFRIGRKREGEKLENVYCLEKWKENLSGSTRCGTLSCQVVHSTTKVRWRLSARVRLLAPSCFNYYLLIELFIVSRNSDMTWILIFFTQ